MTRNERFRLGEHQVSLSDDSVLAAARAAIAEGLPAEARAYKHWAVDVDGTLIGLKWLFSHVTGIPLIEFHSQYARDVLGRRLALKIVNTGNRDLVVGDNKIENERAEEPESKEAQVFFRALTIPEDWLPDDLRQARAKAKRRGNCLYIRLPGLKYCRYELRAEQGSLEIALYFMGKPAYNLALLQSLKPELASISSKLELHHGWREFAKADDLPKFIQGMTDTELGQWREKWR